MDSAPGDSPQESPMLHARADTVLAASKPAGSLLNVTPSATTVTLPTPDPGHVQLGGGEPHHPLRFIFYPISWDSSADSPQCTGADPFFTTGKRATKDATAEQPELSSCGVPTYGPDEDLVYSETATCCSKDAFQSIDRWRRNVIKGLPTELLEPIQDVDAPLPLLSFPHSMGGGRNTDGNLSEAAV